MADELNEALATNIYFDRSFNAKAAKVLPGEYYVTSQDMMIVTVLGSCVAACIRDVGNGIGGMNHFMLPESAVEEQNPLSTSARYGTYAMEILINHISKLGARRAHLEAKVFGGGKVLPGLNSANVGRRNAEFVMQFLETERIRVVASDLLDTFPRKVHYFPMTGKAMVRKLQDVPTQKFIASEQDYGSRLRKVPVGGDIELFS